jgi:hypothetical protein
MDSESSQNFPSIEPKHLENAKLYANRLEMLKHLPLEKDPHIVEVGVALGDLSRFILENLKPAEFFAIDTFDMHKYPKHWGKSSTEIFGELTHFEFYKRAFNSFEEVSILQDLSHVGLDRLPHEEFDLIYLDAGHDFESVESDAKIASSKIHERGILVFNDYIMFDPFINAKYGVVQVVNKMLSTDIWEVVGFAFEKNLFCDIALRKIKR